MKIFLWLILLSLAANVLLAGWWLTNRTPQTQTLAVAAPDSTESPSANNDSRPDSPLPLPSKAQPPTPAQIASWAELQTADLKEFIRRLRAAGCPEETIQDIIVTEVNHRYASRTRELWPERNRSQPFWKTQKNDPAERKSNRERWRKDRELQKEKSALLVELLGVDPEKERRKEEGLDEAMNWTARGVSSVPEGKRDVVQKYLEDFEDKMQDFYARNQGMWDAESRAEQRQLESEKLQGLAQFLTPQEVREYELRESQLASQLSHDLRGLSASRAEYESIFDIRKKYGDSIFNYADVNESKQAREQVEENKKALKAELAAALGSEKAKEYERSQDSSYQQLTRLVKRNDLPAETATKVYDYKEAAEQSAKQLREDKTLTPEQRQTALQQIRTETEKTVKDTLGDKNYNRYLRAGGWWINNIAPPPPKPKP